MIISILFFSSLLGGLSVFLVKRDNSSMLKLILAFSGSYLFAITILHLIPHVYHTANDSIGLFILGGFLFQLFLEQYSEGIEHGHIHRRHDNSAAVFPLSVMLSLCLHAFLEGMPLAGEHGNYLLFGISIHHIPAAFALGSLLLVSSISKKQIVLCLVVFSLMSPLGYLLSYGIKVNEFGDINQYFDRIMAVVIGIFLHISTTILFESSSADHHHFNRRKMIAVILGVSVSLLNYLFH